jgi:hydroxymethylbilane synthase
VVIKTSGDRLQEEPLSDLGGKRLFVKEIDDELLRSEVDLADNSSKDMPAPLPEGLAIAAALPREDPHDAVVLPEGASVALAADPSVEELVSALGQSPSFGTGSVRRVAQLKRIFPKARFTPIRGNLETRIAKLDAGAHDALVLASAGLRRLGFGHRISATLPVAACVPAPGQGIVAVEVRVDDTDLIRHLAAIDDGFASAALTAERALVEALGGGCQTPVGALATPAGADVLTLVGLVAALDGSSVIRASASGPATSAVSLGHQVAAALLGQGADAILADARSRPANGTRSANLSDE